MVILELNVTVLANKLPVNVPEAILPPWMAPSVIWLFCILVKLFVDTSKAPGYTVFTIYRIFWVCIG